MLMLQRKVRFKYTGDNDYKPDGIDKSKYYTVIGYEIQSVEKERDGVTKRQDNLYYVVINDKARSVIVASWNGETIIDNSAECNFEVWYEFFKKTLSMLGVINERLAKIVDKKNDKENGGEDRKG
jgi:hypothetical protein